MKQAILLTGFEAFSNHSSNPTQQIVERLNGEVILDHPIQAHVLPVDFKRAMQECDKLFEKKSWRLHLALGLSSTRRELTPEKFALNCMHCPNRPDNKGRIFQEEPIEINAPLALETTLPVGELTQALQEEGHSAKLSTHAGTYVCNAVMYRSLRISEKFLAATPSGFMHIPADTSLASSSEWPIERLEKAIRFSLEFLVQKTEQKSFFDFLKF